MVAGHESLLESYAYLLVAVLVALESMGLPLPGETILLAAAAYAGLRNLSLSGAIASATGGAIVGDSIGYWLGRRCGLGLLARLPRLQRLTLAVLVVLAAAVVIALRRRRSPRVL